MTENQYPELPDFDAVEQHVYSMCRRYISQDMLEPIYNLMRDYVDADRAMRAQAAPEYSEAMGVAGQAYFELVGKHAHPLPAMWRWSEVYEAMLNAAPSAPAQGDAELLAESKSEGYESSLAYVQALKQHVATYQAERNSAREAYRRVRDKVEAQDTEDQRELVSIGRAVNRAATDLPAGARLQIDLERDAGSVCWLDHRKGVWLTIEGAGELFSVQIHAAIDAAIAQAKESST